MIASDGPPAAEDSSAAHLKFATFMRLNTLILSAAAFAGFAVLLLSWASVRETFSGALAQDVRADFVLVEKSRHTLTLYSHGQPLRTYRVALGRGGLDAKQREGDGRTPEGRYRIDRHLPNSAFHRALHISYPSAEDVKAAGIRHVAPGGAIMIHGLRNGFGWIGAWHRTIDWTNGCVALTDSEIEEISRAVPDGTIVEIRK
jgi:murein L,D-transpeptidase YafK